MITPESIIEIPTLEQESQKLEVAIDKLLSGKWPKRSKTLKIDRSIPQITVRATVQRYLDAGWQITSYGAFAPNGQQHINQLVFEPKPEVPFSIPNPAGFVQTDNPEVDIADPVELIGITG